MLDNEQGLVVFDNTWMRYSTHQRERKYIKGYSFSSFAKALSDKHGKKLMDTATKTVKNVEMSTAKIAPKRVAQKTAGAVGDSIED